jgi:hypothetical protein
MTVPIAFQTIQKTQKVIDNKSGQEKRKSPQTKNDYFREMVRIANRDDQILCHWVLADVWYSSNDNLKCIKLELNKDFIMPVKSNRLAALSQAAKRAGQFLGRDHM